MAELLVWLSFIAENVKGCIRKGIKTETSTNWIEVR